MYQSRSRISLSESEAEESVNNKELDDTGQYWMITILDWMINSSHSGIVVIIQCCPLMYGSIKINHYHNSTGAYHNSEYYHVSTDCHQK